MQWLRKRVSRRRSRVFTTSRIYPSLGFCVPQAILEDSTFAIAKINVTFYYSATLASVYASSARRSVCIICIIIALYSDNAAETISEGLKSKFPGGIYALLVPPMRISAYAPVSHVATDRVIATDFLIAQGNKLYTQRL